MIQSLKFAGDIASVSPGEWVRLDKREENNRVHNDVDGTVRYPARMSICQHNIIRSCGKLWNNWTSQKHEW